MEVTPEQRDVLLIDTISRINKIWIAIDLKHRGFYVEWRWAGRQFCSRIEIQLEPDGQFIKAKSYDDDVRPKLMSPKRSATPRA